MYVPPFFLEFGISFCRSEFVLLPNLHHATMPPPPGKNIAVPVWPSVWPSALFYYFNRCLYMFWNKTLSSSWGVNRRYDEDWGIWAGTLNGFKCPRYEQTAGGRKNSIQHPSTRGNTGIEEQCSFAGWLPCGYPAIYNISPLPRVLFSAVLPYPYRLLLYLLFYSACPLFLDSDVVVRFCVDDDDIGAVW